MPIRKDELAEEPAKPTQVPSAEKDASKPTPEAKDPVQQPAEGVFDEDFEIDPNKFVNTSDKEVDYSKIIKKFGCSAITPELIQRFEKVTGHQAHILLRRGIFFAHRDLNILLDFVEAQKPVYLYTGRGPSTDAMHLGHLLPFIMTKWLQDVLKCPLVIQITDDEKFFYQRVDAKQEDLLHYSKIADENIKDIIACGFDPELTFIFKDTEYMGQLYPNVCRMQKAITYNQIKGIFGLNGSENCGKVAFPAIQAVPCMSSCFPHIFGKRHDALCLIPMGVDQDPYFRMTRDIAPQLKFPKPTCLHSKFFPALQGWKSKMSSSDPNSAIFLNDTEKQIKDKINKYAFSGGKATIEEHRALGGDTTVDIPFQYLKYFHESDEELAEIERKYTKGELLSGELKKIAISVVSKIVASHQDAKKKVTDELLKTFLKVRPLLHK